MVMFTMFLHPIRKLTQLLHCKPKDSANQTLRPLQRPWLPVLPSPTRNWSVGRRAGPLVQVAATEGHSEACVAKVATMRMDPGTPTSSVLGEGRDRYRLCCQRAEQVLNFPRVKSQLTSELQLVNLQLVRWSWRHRPSLCLFTPTIEDGCRTCQTVKGALRARMPRRR